jgi:hypothetical protein
VQGSIEAYGYGLVLASGAVCLSSGFYTCYPLAGIVGSGYVAVGGLGPFEGDEGAMAPKAGYKAAVLDKCLSRQWTLLYLDTGCP